MSAVERIDAWLERADEVLAESGDLAQPPFGKLHARLRKERDLELHIRSGRIFDVEYVWLGDYEPSIGTYREGVLIERQRLGQVIRSLVELRRLLGGGSL